MKKLRTLYVYITPSCLCVAYLLYIILGVNSKNSVMWIADSKGFQEMCKTIVEFSSIILGIYGFLIPAVIGREDDFNKKFWKNVDKKSFSKDVHRLIISGIITIILSIVLLVSDIYPKVLCEFIVGCLCWILLFYCCSSIRFIGIFISLILENRDADEDTVSLCNEQTETKKRLDSKIDTF